MAKIQNETAYKAAMERIEELLPLVDDDTPLSDKNLIELDLLYGEDSVSCIFFLRSSILFRSAS